MEECKEYFVALNAAIVPFTAKEKDGYINISARSSTGEKVIVQTVVPLFLEDVPELIHAAVKAASESYERSAENAEEANDEVGKMLKNLLTAVHSVNKDFVSDDEDCEYEKYY